MDGAPTTTGMGVRPVFYAGRFADEVSGLPDGCLVLGDKDVLPSSLAAAVRGATAIVVLDLFSFPFEAMPEEGWDAPLVSVLPEGFDAGFLVAVFGEPLFGRLGPFDAVATADDAVWEDLSRRYRWSEGQRLRTGDGGPAETAAGVASLLEAGPAGVGPYGNGRAGADGNGRPGARGPVRSKAAYRVQAAALEPQFVAARGGRAADVPFRVLEVGARDGRWVGSFDTLTEYVGVLEVGDGVGADEGATGGAESPGVPGIRFERSGTGLLLPYEDESFDLTFCVDSLGRHPGPRKRTLISEMWRVTRPGGRLLFLEDFVAEGRPSAPDAYPAYPVSVLEFNALVVEETAGRVTLEHVESLRYPGDHLVRAGVIMLSKLGVPARW